MCKSSGIQLGGTMLLTIMLLASFLPCHGIELIISDSGRNTSWSAQLKPGDTFDVKGTDGRPVGGVFNMSSKIGQYLLPMPGNSVLSGMTASQEAVMVDKLGNYDQLNEDGRTEHVVSIIDRLRIAVVNGEKQFEIRLLENTPRPNSPAESWVDNPNAARFGRIAFAAIGRVVDFLKQNDTPVKITAAFADTGASTFANSIDTWRPYASFFRRADLVEGWAGLEEAREAIAALGTHRVRLFVESSSGLSARSMTIAHPEVASLLANQSPGLAAYSITALGNAASETENVAHWFSLLSGSTPIAVKRLSSTQSLSKAEKPGSEDDLVNEAIRRAYEKLEKLRELYNRSCGGSSAETDYCKKLKKQIEELQKLIDEVTGRGSQQSQGAKTRLIDIALDEGTRLGDWMILTPSEFRSPLTGWDPSNEQSYDSASLASFGVVAPTKALSLESADESVSKASTVSSSIDANSAAPANGLLATFKNLSPQAQQLFINNLNNQGYAQIATGMKNLTGMQYDNELINNLSHVDTFAQNAAQLTGYGNYKSLSASSGLAGNVNEPLLLINGSLAAIRLGANGLANQALDNQNMRDSMMNAQFNTGLQDLTMARNLQAITDRENTTTGGISTSRTLNIGSSLNSDVCRTFATPFANSVGQSVGGPVAAMQNTTIIGSPSMIESLSAANGKIGPAAPLSGLNFSCVDAPHTFQSPTWQPAFQPLDISMHQGLQNYQSFNMPSFDTFNVKGVLLQGAANVEGAPIGASELNLVFQDNNGVTDFDKLRHLATAMWTAYFSIEGPGISIDPVDTDIKHPHFNKHHVRHIGQVRNTDLGRIMRETDYLMKRWAVGTDRPDLPGFLNPDEISNKTGHRVVGRPSRFWLIPQGISFKRAGGMLVLSAGRMSVQTEYLEDNPTGEKNPENEDFASWFTTNYDQIAYHYPIYQDLFEYAQLVSLCTYLKEQKMPLLWFLLKNREMILTEHSLEYMPALAKRSSKWYVNISGGVELAATKTVRETTNTSDDAGLARLVAQARADSENQSHAGNQVSVTDSNTTYTVSQAGSLSLSGTRALGNIVQTDFSHFEQYTEEEGTNAWKLVTPGLEIIRHYSPELTSLGQFGPGWHLAVPFHLTASNNAPLQPGSPPATLEIHNVLSGEMESMQFSRITNSGVERFAYVPVRKNGFCEHVASGDGTWHLQDCLGVHFWFDSDGDLTKMELRPDMEIPVKLGDKVLHRIIPGYSISYEYSTGSDGRKRLDSIKQGGSKAIMQWNKSTGAPRIADIQVKREGAPAELIQYHYGADGHLAAIQARNGTIKIQYQDNGMRISALNQ